MSPPTFFATFAPRTRAELSRLTDLPLTRSLPPDVSDPMPPTRREIRRQETSERILDAAMSLMVERGYEAFTIARLAKDLDYAVGALYRYFKGKDAILAALQLRVVQAIDVDLAAVAEATDAHTARARTVTETDALLLHVLTAIGVYESLTYRRPTHHRLLGLSLGDPREFLAQEVVDAGMMPALRGVLGQVAMRLHAAAEAGALQAADPMRRTVILWGATQGLMQLRKLERFEPGLADRRLTDELFAALLVGWGAERDRFPDLLDRARKILARLDA